MDREPIVFRAGEVNEEARFERPAERAFLYLAGGYSSFDYGCPAWGSADPSQTQFVGGRAGWIRLLLEDGGTASIPLVFGHTMWFHGNWMNGGAPFKTAAADPEAERVLRGALFLKGAFEGEKPAILRIATGGLKIAGVRVDAEPDKPGVPVFTAGCLCDEPGEGVEFEGVRADADPFYDTHTMDPRDPLPAAVADAITAMRRILYTSFDDFAAAPRYASVPGAAPATLRFRGTPEAEIATGVYAENLADMRGKVDDEGFFHTSSKGAPTWHYDGFGTFRPDSGNYWKWTYSRDGARGVISLINAGDLATAGRALRKFNRDLMYFPEHADTLTLGGKPIPGHWTVCPNHPPRYLESLVARGWPTRYTPERFGDEWSNIGNQETDGHGLMLTADLLYLRAAGDPDEDRAFFPYVAEAVRFLEWCFEHPELSFMQDDVLYGETEAAMNSWTLYANVPNRLGLAMAVELAERLGEDEHAARWAALRDRLGAGIGRAFAAPGDADRWDFGKRGFYHDPVVTMGADMVGFDPEGRLPDGWLARSRNTYAEDLASIEGWGGFAPRGLGYDHNMIAQSALLLDRTADASRFVDNLSRLCWSPRLPSSYIAPEAASIDLEGRVIRRQGDLGNLVQQAETLKTLQIVAGAFADGERIRIMPRLPRGWALEMRDHPVVRGGRTCLVSCDHRVADGILSCDIALSEARDLSLRVGPFAPDTPRVSIRVDGGDARSVEAFASGDAAWAWVDLRGKHFRVEAKGDR